MGAERDGPSGVVAFVLSDIEGSTKLARVLGDAYAELIGRHNELLRAVWYVHGGYVFGTRGDSFLVAFADPDAAVARGGRRATPDRRRTVARRATGAHPDRVARGIRPLRGR